MSYVKAFLMFWYDFIIGDDWVIALGVVLALIGTHLLVRNEVTAWWLMPVAVIVLLSVSLYRGARKSLR